MKVSFMIIGAQKSATTTLYSILNAHPGLQGSDPKEPHFFSEAKDWRKELPRYEALFEPKAGAIYFEASTSYTFWPLRNLSIWEDIYAYNPEMKFIYLVRNPVDRIISAYMHSYSRGFTRRTLHDAVTEERAYIDVSSYATQITPFINRFGRSNVLIIDFDDLIDHRERTLHQVSEFLGIDFNGFSSYRDEAQNTSLGTRRLHRRWDWLKPVIRVIRKVFPVNLHSLMRRFIPPRFDRKPFLNKRQKRSIIERLETEIDALELLMDKDLRHWKKVD